MDVYQERGIPIEKQWESYQSIVGQPYDKNSVDAYTRARIIWMYGTETEQWFFYHNYARTVNDPQLKATIAQIRRSEDQQRSALTHLFDPTETITERTLGYEQLAVDLTAALAMAEPDPYVKQTLDFGLLEDFDHLFRYSCLLTQQNPSADPNQIVRHGTEIRPGRPTAEEHRHPLDSLRYHVDAKTADPITLLHILSITAPEQQTRQYYMSHGYEFKERNARELYAEIGEVEEQHVTQYESLMDPNLSMLQMAVAHEYNEVYDYHSCLQMESDPKMRAVWEKHLSEELEHLRIMGDLLRQREGIEPQVMFPAQLPMPVLINPAKDYINEILRTQVDLRPNGMEYMMKDQLPKDWPSHAYARAVDAEHAPSLKFTQFGGQQQGGQRKAA